MSFPQYPAYKDSEFEQSAIATFLDRETAKIDALVADYRSLIELLQGKRQAVISHAVTKGLDPRVPMKDSGVEWCFSRHESRIRATDHGVDPQDDLSIAAAGLHICVPPDVEQTAVVEYLDRETVNIDHLIADADEAVTLLQERRTALIFAAVTGKIDVRGLIDQEAA